MALIRDLFASASPDKRPYQYFHVFSFALYSGIAPRGRFNQKESKTMKTKSLGWVLALTFAVVAIPIAPKGAGTVRDIEGPPPPGGITSHSVADIEGPPPPGGITSVADIEGPPPPGGITVAPAGDIEGPPPPGGLA